MKALYVLYILCFPLLDFSQNTIEAGEIVNRLNKGEKVELRNMRISGTLDLTRLQNLRAKPVKQADAGNVYYGPKFYASRVNSELVFINCSFGGDIIASRQRDNDTIYEADFTQAVRFEGCTFEKRAAFRHSWFKGEASFKDCLFSGEVDFRHTYFAGQTSFKETVFRGPIDFRHTQFWGQAIFEKASFETPAEFTHTEFQQGVRFEQASFKDAATFRHTVFSENATFTGASFKDNADFGHAELDGKGFLHKTSEEEN